MAAAKTDTKRRRGPDHSGVTIKAPAGRHGWRLRWTDPDTGRECRETIPNPQRRTEEGRAQHAADKAAEIRERRRVLASGTGARKRGLAVDAVIQRYFEDHAHELAPGTLELYRRACDRFEAYCARHGLASFDEISRPELLRFRAWLLKAPRYASKSGQVQRGNGRARNKITVNGDLRAVRTVLGYLRKLDLLPLLAEESRLKEGLARFKEEGVRREILSGSQIRLLLRAVIAHDAARWDMTREEKTRAGERKDSVHGQTPRHAPLAPLVLFLLLTGARRNEALGLTWAHVDLNAVGNDGSRVGHVTLAATKGNKDWRQIWLEHVPSLRSLLAALELAQGRPSRGKPVFHTTQHEILAAFRGRLVDEYGAPMGVGPQWLRRTCGSYLTCAPGIFGAASAFMSARQLGHSVAVAERHYIDTVRGIPADAKTLEAAMGIEDLAAAIVAGVRPASKRLAVAK